MFFTINHSFPFEWWERLLMSMAIFVMIVAWGGILQSMPWARALEALRLVAMAIVLLSILERHGMATWFGWAAILTALWCGLSILWLTVKMAGTMAVEVETS